jgi:PAS domain S-box-containing protein
MRSAYFRDPSSRPMGIGRDLYGLRRDGTEFPIEIGLTPIRSDDRLFVLSSIVNITERKRLEARFRATVEWAPAAMIMIDPAGAIVLANRAAEQLFDYQPDKLLGQKVEILIPERFRASHPKLRTGFFTEPRGRRMGSGLDLFGLRSDGSEFPVEIGLNPVHTDEGSFVLAAIVDLTERKHSVEQLSKANEALETSNLELQQFAYIASHDLQTPLRAISGFAQFLQSDYKGKLDPKANQYIKRIVDNVQRMQRLVDDLLTFSRVESRSQPFTTVCLRDSFDDAQLLLETCIAEVGCQVTCDDLPAVRGDRTQLSQLLQNLIGNAVKYHSDAEPSVHVSAQRQDNQWLVSVRDNGIGIAPKHHERIFEIFQRLHTNEAYPGTGIGLAVCRRIVHRHGGRIWVDSEPGHGSTFYFTIPAQRGSQA